ncbi:MAG: AAA family ATPase [Nocardioidaceae bacterium]|nr:AAA family ATPase [Nocardioidaceae bacterium]
MPVRWSGTAHRVFVGRSRELALLEQAWGEAAAGARQAVFVGGDPGGGKSRLLAEVATMLHERGAAVLLGSCSEEFGPPYQPFVQPIETLATDLVSGRIPLAEVSGSDAAPLAERLATLCGQHPSQSRAAQHRRRLYDAAVDAFRAAAAQRPLVVVLEDLHWAGSTALQLLGYLVEQTADATILLLASHRTTAPDRSPLLERAITPLYRLDGVQRLDLAGLDTKDVADYLIREGDVSASRARACAAELRAQTGGNPFFLRELWRDLAARGGPAALRRADFRAPESVRHTIERRLDRLAAPHREVLELAAVIGEDFDSSTLVAASDWTHDTTLEALDAAVDFGLVEPAPGPDGVFRFPHALVRQAVLGLLASSRRAHEHARVAQVIETRSPESGRDIQQLAYHYAGAHMLGFADKAVRYLIEAAGVADRSLAHEDAARSLEQAASLTDDADERDSLLLAASRSHLLGADFARARELAERVATNGSPRHAVRGAIAYEAAAWRPGHQGQRSVELLSAALASIDRQPADPDYVRATASLGRALAFTGSTDEARAYGARAIELAEAVGDEGLLADTLQASLWQGLRPRDAPGKLERATRLSALAHRTGDLGQLGPAAYYRGAIAYLRGDPDSMDGAYGDLVRTARATGQGFFGYMAGCMAYARQFVAGQFTAAERTCAGLLDMGESFGTDDTEGSYGVQTYMVRREAGRLEQVRRLVTGEELPTDHWAPGLLALYTELGMTAPASRLLRWLLDQQLPRYERTAQWPGVLAFLVEAALATEDEAAARQLRGPLLEYAGLNLVAGQFVAVFGSADRYLGAVDSLLGTGTPEEWFAAALEMDTRMAAPVHQALTLAAHARHLRRSQADARRAAELVDQARSLGEPLGHRRVLGQLDALTDADAGSRGGMPDGLTARETEVLRLLGEGLSNRDIAGRLVISDNTAANHVRNILAKTGSDNRTQAAMYAAAQGLVPARIRPETSTRRTGSSRSPRR